MHPFVTFSLVSIAILTQEMHDKFYHFKAISYGRHLYLYGDCLILCLNFFYNLRETHHQHLRGIITSLVFMVYPSVQYFDIS